MFIIEAGVNHFGKKKELDLITNYIFKSTFKSMTLMCHFSDFYKKYKKKGINFEISEKTYSDLIKKFKKNKKKLGLSVCDYKTFSKVEHLNFDFYKLLSIGINDEKVINALKKKNKKIYISTGFNASLKKIKKCIKLFDGFEKIELLHTPMTYQSQRLNLNKIKYLNKKFKLPVGYSHHNNNINTLYALSYYEPKVIFLYCKQLLKKNRSYPDNDHAIYIKYLEEIKNNYLQCVKMHKKQNGRFKNEKIFKTIKI